jgi:hypothetical protein
MVAQVMPSPEIHALTIMPERRRSLSHYLDGYEADESEVRAVPTPDIHGAHVPIPHESVFDHVHHQLNDMGEHFDTVTHALYRGGDRYIGLGLLKGPRHHGRDTVVGWFNSHDKSKAVTLLFGERVFVCFNLLLTAEVRLARKHTRHVARDLPELVAHGLSKLDDIRAVQAARYDAYMNTRLTPEAGHDLLIRLLDERVFAGSKIPRILDEWRAPSFPEHREDESLMRLHNAITYHTRGIRTLARRHAKMQQTMDEFVGFRPRIIL